MLTGEASGVFGSPCVANPKIPKPVERHPDALSSGEAADTRPTKVAIGVKTSGHNHHMVSMARLGERYCRNPNLPKKCEAWSGGRCWWQRMSRSLFGFSRDQGMQGDSATKLCNIKHFGKFDRFHIALGILSVLLQIGQNHFAKTLSRQFVRR